MSDNLFTNYSETNGVLMAIENNSDVTAPLTDEIYVAALAETSSMAVHLPHLTTAESASDSESAISTQDVTNTPGLAEGDSLPLSVDVSRELPKLSSSKLTRFESDDVFENDVILEPTGEKPEPALAPAAMATDTVVIPVEKEESVDAATTASVVIAVVPAAVKAPLKSITRRDTLLELKMNYIKSPDGRYIKLDEEIGRGSFKTVYKGLDCETGVNVAWCELMDMGRNTKAARLKFKEEVEMLKDLRHPNILRFYDSWEYNKKIVLVTELMTSGTLKQYIRRFRKTSVKWIANWCRQILKGLVFLHTRAVPVIHRDLKCDNFFINGQTGRVKIGDLGLAILKPQSYARTVIGTPEFMAPEMYEEHYDESVDVYAFGMCMLEMATSEYPYKECTNPGQIFLRVTKGKKPESYQRVESPAIKFIIDKCIQSNPLKRMKASELLRLDFFNEWSVHMDCTVTSKPDILRFRISDDVIKNRKEVQKDGEAVQFDFNIKQDNHETVVRDLVNSGYLDEGNFQVAVKLMVEKITYFTTLRLTRSLTSTSTPTDQGVDPQAAFRAANDQLSRQSSESPASNADLSSTKQTCSEHSATSANKNGGDETGERKAGNESVRRNKSIAKPSSKDSEGKPRSLKRKSLQILIQDITTADGATLVSCQLHTGKATVTFSFNRDLDNADEITQNLDEYLVDSEQQKTAQQQVSYIIDLVKTHKNHPDIAKIVCEQRYHVQGGSMDVAHDTPIHSRSSSKDLVELGIVSNRDSGSCSSIGASSGEQESARVSPGVADRMRAPSFPAHDTVSRVTALSNLTYLRDRSTSWSANTGGAPGGSSVVREGMNRKISTPAMVENSSALRTTQSTPGTPALQKRFSFQLPHQQDINEEESMIADFYKLEDRSHYLKKAFDLTELGKSIETIMSRQPAYVTNSSGRTRQLSAASKTDGEVISPNDSVGTNSTNGNSLTCDSGFCSFLPLAVRQNSVSVPIAETTKKVGRFAIGMVKEQKHSILTDDTAVSTPVTVTPDSEGAPEIYAAHTTTNNNNNSTNRSNTTAPMETSEIAISPVCETLDLPTTIVAATIVPQVTDLPVVVTHGTDVTPRMVKSSAVEKTDSPPLAGLRDSAININSALAMDCCVEDLLLENILKRQAEEKQRLEEEHQAEVLKYKLERQMLASHFRMCSNCARLQSFCAVHAVANALLLPTHQTKKSQPPSTSVKAKPRLLTEIPTKKLDYVSNFLRNGKHCNKSESGKGRRIRHNSVEQVLQTVKGADGEPSPTTPDSANCQGRIDEEPSFSDESSFIYPSVDVEKLTRSVTTTIPQSAVQRSRIQEEVLHSHQSVVRNLQAINCTRGMAMQPSQAIPAPKMISAQQEAVKQALESSRAQVLKTLDSMDPPTQQ